MLRIGYARLWHRVYYVWYQLTRLVARHGVIATFAPLIVLIAVTAYWLPTLQAALEPHFATTERLGSLRSLIVTTGGALIGAAAIVFALVMFAMQVNVERMPHGLFRKLSADRSLLGALAATFSLAIAVATLSVVPDKSWLAIAVFGAGWGIVLILVLFLYAYRRALSLINPVQQLGFVVDTARKDLRRWVRLAQHAAPFLERPNDEKANPASALQSTHDLTRITFFNLNPHWTNEVQRSLMHAMSFAHRYAEQGDHEVSSAALAAIVRINTAYVKAKGKTFFAQHFLFNSPLATDKLINDSLEHLRQNLRIGVTRGDERQIEQTLQTMALLVHVYLGIDYSTQYASKTHAHLAAGYLSGAADSILPHNMPDVLMEWMHLMGQTAQRFIVHAEPNDVATLTEKIGVIAGACIASEGYRPVTLAGMEQLARLTLTLIRSEEHDLHFAFGKVKSNVAFVAKITLALPDTPFSRIHSTYLGPYYSGTSTDTLQQWLTDLANAVSDAQADDEHAQRVIHNIEQWAEELHLTEKELFLLAIEKKSHFIIDVIHWIAHVTKLLLAVSNAPACDEHTREELRRHALWLVSVLDWVPDNSDAVTFVGIFELTETLFDAALDAHHHDCEELSLKVGKMLLSWAFKAGKHQTVWGILQRSMYALATLAIVKGGGAHSEQLKQAITEGLAGPNPPDQEQRDRAAREIRRKAATLYGPESVVSRIEYAMSQADHEQVAPLLNAIANILSPDTAGEPIDIDYF